MCISTLFYLLISCHFYLNSSYISLHTCIDSFYSSFTLIFVLFFN